MGCLQTIKGIAKECGTNIGGVRAVWITNADNISEVEASDGIITNIALNGEAKFYRYNFRVGQATLTKTATIDASNGINYVTSEVALNFTKMDAVKRAEIMALTLGEFVAIVEDNNGVYWLIGADVDQESRVTVNYAIASASEGTTGTAKGDANQYSITLQYEGLYPATVDSGIISDITEDVV